MRTLGSESSQQTRSCSRSSTTKAAPSSPTGPKISSALSTRLAESSFAFSTSATRGTSRLSGCGHVDNARALPTCPQPQQQIQKSNHSRGLNAHRFSRGGNFPTGTIEKKYNATGPWAVTVATGAGCCDSKGDHYDLYYPTNLGANGFRHPIITWGNGTKAVSSHYSYFLKHLASWGFVIVATQDENTNPGQTIVDAANFLVNANSDPQSIFVNKLKVDQIGAIGHSQ